MYKVICLIIFFFILLSPKVAYAQTASCPGATLVQGSCTPINQYDACNNQYCHCGYQNTSANCAYEQDQLCDSTKTCNTGTVGWCTGSSGKNCAGLSAGGGRIYASSPIDCWNQNGHAVCTGLDGNQCGFCQGWAYCSCSTGTPTEVACNPNNSTDLALGCGRSNTPCAGIFCPVATPPPACTFSYINVNGGGSYAEVPSGGTISINWAVTGADNTKSCTWVGDNPGSNPSPQSGSVQFSITNTTPNPIDKNYQLSCFNPSNQSCTSGQVSVRIPGPTPTPAPSPCTPTYTDANDTDCGQ